MPHSAVIMPHSANIMLASCSHHATFCPHHMRTSRRSHHNARITCSHRATSCARPCGASTRAARSWRGTPFWLSAKRLGWRLVPRTACLCLHLTATAPSLPSTLRNAPSQWRAGAPPPPRAELEKWASLSAEGVGRPCLPPLSRYAAPLTAMSPPPPSPARSTHYFLVSQLPTL